MAAVDETAAWLDARLAAAGVTRSGPVSVHRRRPWADVLTAPTDSGPVWLKQCAAATAFEARLYPLLSATAPDAVLVPYGVDVERGWILLPDAGPAVRAELSGPDLTAAMGRALGRYARLQRALAPQVDVMLDLGVADMRPSVLPQRFDEALAAVTPWVEARGGPDDRRDHEALHALWADVQRWSAALGASAVPVSLDHNDLHSNNVLVSGRFYDWGDSVIAHPFATLLVPTEGSEDPAVLRDAYLAEFADLAPRPELEATADLALRLAHISRALAWQRALGPEALDHELAAGPFQHLRALLPGHAP